MSTHKRRLQVLIVCFCVVTVAGLVVLGPGLPTRVGADGPNYVGLVVDFGGDTETRCVSFDGGSISGMEALKDLFSVETAFGGGAVCKIADTGCPGGDSSCWCQCQNPEENCTFWSYWHLDGEGWTFSQSGAKEYQLRHGDVDGWRWATQSFDDPDADPPTVSFEDACGQYLVTDTPTPTDSPTPTDTLVPTVTPTPTETPTSEPTETSTSTSVPESSIDFSLSTQQILQGECATLGWKVGNAKEIYLDGQGVTGQESRQVCPQAGTHTYKLHVVGLDDEEFDREATLNVSANDASTPGTTMGSAGEDSTSGESDPPSGDRDGQADDRDESAGSSTTQQPTLTPTEAPDQGTPQSVLAPTAAPTASEAVAMHQPGGMPTNQTSAGEQIGPTGDASEGEAGGASAPESGQGSSGGLLTSKVTWYILLGSTAVGAVGAGGLAFLACLAVLFLVYRHFSRVEIDDSEYPDDTHRR